MDKKIKRKTWETKQDAQCQQRQEQQQQEQQQQEQQQQKRQKGDKRLRREESRRLRDSGLTERRISELQQTLPTLDVEGAEETPEETPETLNPHRSEADEQRNEVEIHRSSAGKKVPKRQSLAAFSAAIGSLLAEGAGGSSAVLSEDGRIFENLRAKQAENKLKREALAERRHRRGLPHCQPAADDAEANLKRLALKGTVRFLNVLMAARRKAAAEEKGGKNKKIRRRFSRRPGGDKKGKPSNAAKTTSS